MSETSEFLINNRNELKNLFNDLDLLGGLKTQLDKNGNTKSELGVALVCNISKAYTDSLEELRDEISKKESSAVPHLQKINEEHFKNIQPASGETYMDVLSSAILIGFHSRVDEHLKNLIQSELSPSEGSDFYVNILDRYLPSLANFALYYKNSNNYRKLLYSGLILRAIELTCAEQHLYFHYSSEKVSLFSAVSSRTMKIF